jgi:MurNAc alpha-1-phosphate uridylyltransferase
MDCLQLVVPREHATGHSGKGDWDMDGAGRLARGTGLVYCGTQIVNPARLADIPDIVFSFNKLWDVLIADGRCFGVVHPGGWCDVGRPESIPLAEAMLNV